MTSSRIVSAAGLAVVCVTLTAILGASLLGLRTVVDLRGERVTHEALTAAVRRVPWNARYWRELAFVQQAFGMHEAAATSFRSAIDRFPACARCWVGMAETELARGIDPRATLDKAVAYGRSSTTVRTRAAVVYARLGEAGRALAEFSAALGGHREDRRDFFVLLHQIYDDSTVVEQVLAPEDLRSYMPFAWRERPPSAVRAAWQRLVETGQEDSLTRFHASWLLGRGNVHEAYRLARSAELPLDGVELGDFDERGRDRFDWTFERVDGVRADVAACRDCRHGDRALRLRFDGNENPHFVGVRRTVPVRPGATYRLAGRVRSLEITSARGPQLLVRGVRRRDAHPSVDCAFEARGPEVRLTRPWHDYSFTFAVPDGCEGVRVFVARYSTQELNRLIEGEFWVDGLRLASVSPEQSAD